MSHCAISREKDNGNGSILYFTAVIIGFELDLSNERYI